MKIFTFTAAALLTVAAVPAHAETLQYVLNGVTPFGNIEYAKFRLDSNPVLLPNNIGLGFGFRVKFVPGVFQFAGDISNLKDIMFYSGGIGGGFQDVDTNDPTGDTYLVNVVGPQLYSGSEANPTLLTGDFTLYDFSDQDQVSPILLSVTTVPEPATWAMMLGGFGVVGIAARRRGKRTLAAA